jgi:hypothetical protein
MTDDRDDRTSDTGPVRNARRGTTPIRLRPPHTVPISEEDYEQAVTALSTMILSWWQSRQQDDQIK